MASWAGTRPRTSSVPRLRVAALQLEVRHPVVRQHLDAGVLRLSPATDHIDDRTGAAQVGRVTCGPSIGSRTPGREAPYQNRVDSPVIASSDVCLLYTSDAAD